jgi:hypothetical protein
MRMGVVYVLLDHLMRPSVLLLSLDSGNTNNNIRYQETFKIK